MNKLNKILLLATLSTLAFSTQAFAEETQKEEIENTDNKEEVAEEQISCIALYEPVCAEVETLKRCVKEPCPKTVQKTFGNSCTAGVAGAKIIHEGTCEKDNVEVEDGIKNPIEIIDNAVESVIKVKDETKNEVVVDTESLRDTILEALKEAKNEQERIAIYNKLTGKEIGVVTTQEVETETEEATESEVSENETEETEVESETSEQNQEVDSQETEETEEVEKTEKAEENNEKVILEKSEYIFTNLDKIISDVKTVKADLSEKLNSDENKISDEVAKLIKSDLEKVDTSIENAENKKNESWLELFEVLGNGENESLEVDLKIIENKLAETKIYIKEAFLNLKSAANNIENSLLLEK